MEKQTKNINKIPKGTEFSTHFEEGFNTLSGEHFFPEEDKLCFDYFDRKNNIFIMYENNGKRGDRKSVVQGKSVDLGGRRIIKKKKRTNKQGSRTPL